MSAMFSTKDKLLRRARGIRRPPVLCITSDIPPVPPLPADLPVQPLAISNGAQTAAPAAIPSMSPISCSPESYSSHLTHRREHSRSTSICSRVSHASSSWSSAGSMASALSSSPPLTTGAGSEWNPLRMHPVPMPPTPTSFHFSDEGVPRSSAAHGFDFGFASKPSYGFRGVRLVSSSQAPFDDDMDDDDDDFDLCEFASNDDDCEFSTVLSPPPHYNRLRQQQSEADLQTLPPRSSSAADATSSAPASPVRLRVQSAASSKPGDWKRRGVVFSTRQVC